MAKKIKSTSVSISNRKARFEFELLEFFTAGIQLLGTEIKSLREGNANLAEAFCYVHQSQVWVTGMFIAEYSYGSYNNHEPKRIRKLLLNKREIDKLESALQDVGVTIVPLKLFINSKGWAKIEIALAKGKKLHDKRHDLKQKDDQRQIDRALKDYR
ncbi:MAG: SsrA-binding protein [Flavobacteriales bacterium]|nr:SsrA-binding protein [Flavobacteriales bacterium]|tara:strand:+ start:982 stop:1452 length:471 start_codon:yes stop_codon:yes gene_type:complete